MSKNKKEPMNNNRIKEIRLSQHKTQKDLAKLLGVSEQAIAYYEKALREPSLASWVKMADYLNVPTPYLQGISNYIKDESDNLKPLMFDENGKINWNIIQKLFENDLSAHDYSKRQFEEANLIIDALFSNQPEEKENYKKIIADSKFTNGFDDLPEPVAAYTGTLSWVSEMFFSAQKGDSVAKECIQEIDKLYFEKYDPHVVHEAQERLQKNKHNNKK